MKNHSFETTPGLSRLAIALIAAGLCSACGGSPTGVPPTADPTSCTDQSSSRTLASVDETIAVDAASDAGTARPLIGFLHGIAAPSGADYDFPGATATRIAALAPTLWRVSDTRHYLKAKSFGAKIIYSSSDEYFNYQPIYYPWNDNGLAAGNFDNWAAFDANELSVLQQYLAASRPVEYWGVLNEPQFVAYNSTDQQRLLDTFRHGYHDFKDGHPEQKVVAPSTNGYNSLVMEPLLDFSVVNGLQFDAITWHEIGSRPEDVVGHVNDLRTRLAARPALGSPPVVIEEYATPNQHHLPGFAVAWFFYLEQAGVQHAIRACWNMTDSANGVWSNCWDGLNGLFMKDNLTPQPLYWVFERYAQMLGRKLNTVSSASTDVVGIARSTAADPSTGGETKVLVGRFASDAVTARSAAKKVAIDITGLPSSTRCVSVDVQRIPALGPDVMTGADPVAQALAAPQVVDHYTAIPVAGKVTVFVPTFADRDAYYIAVR